MVSVKLRTSSPLFISSEKSSSCGGVSSETNNDGLKLACGLDGLDSISSTRPRLVVIETVSRSGSELMAFMSDSDIVIDTTLPFSDAVVN